MRQSSLDEISFIGLSPRISLFITLWKFSHNFGRFWCRILVTRLSKNKIPSFAPFPYLVLLLLLLAVVVVVVVALTEDGKDLFCKIDSRVIRGLYSDEVLFNLCHLCMQKIHAFEGQPGQTKVAVSNQGYQMQWGKLLFEMETVCFEKLKRNIQTRH